MKYKPSTGNHNTGCIVRKSLLLGIMTQVVLYGKAANKEITHKVQTFYKESWHRLYCKEKHTAKCYHKLGLMKSMLKKPKEENTGKEKSQWKRERCEVTWREYEVTWTGVWEGYLERCEVTWTEVWKGYLERGVRLPGERWRLEWGADDKGLAP